MSGSTQLRLGRIAALLACGSLALVSSPARGQSVDTYGTTPVSYASVGSNAFQPSNNTIVYQNIEILTGTSGGLFTTNPPLPSGAHIVSVEWNFCSSPGTSQAPYHAVGLHRGARGVGDHRRVRVRKLLPRRAADARADGRLSLQGARSAVAVTIGSGGTR